MLNEVHVNTTSIKTTTTKNRRMLHHQYRRDEDYIAKPQHGMKNKPYPIQAATTIMWKNTALVLSLAPVVSKDRPDKENQPSKQWYTYQVSPNSNPESLKDSNMNVSVDGTTMTTQKTATRAAAAVVEGRVAIKGKELFPYDEEDVLMNVQSPPSSPPTTNWTGNGTNTMILRLMLTASSVLSSKTQQQRPLSSWYELCHYDNQQQQQRAGKRFKRNLNNHARTNTTQRSHCSAPGRLILPNKLQRQKRDPKQQPSKVR